MFEFMIFNNFYRLFDTQITNADLKDMKIPFPFLNQYKGM